MALEWFFFRDRLEWPAPEKLAQDGQSWLQSKLRRALWQLEPQNPDRPDPDNLLPKLNVMHEPLGRIIFVINHIEEAQHEHF